jgi:tRNA A37 methylthiotransferase MiaB
MNIYIETYGCSANQNNGEIMAGMLERAGHIIVKDEKNSDINILNSCIVKGPTLQSRNFQLRNL